MPREAIEKIKEAESKALDIRKAAEEKMRANSASAHTRGSELVLSLEKNAHETAKKNSEKTDQVIALMREKAARDRLESEEDFIGSSEVKLERAVDYIVKEMLMSEKKSDR